MSNTTKASTTTAKKDEEKPVIVAVPNPTKSEDKSEETTEMLVGEVVDNRTAFQKAKDLLKNKKTLAGLIGTAAVGSLVLIVRLRNSADVVEVEDETLSA